MSPSLHFVVAIESAADFGHPALMDQNAEASRGFHPAMNQNGKRKMGEAGGELFSDKQARMGLDDTSAEHSERS